MPRITIHIPCYNYGRFVADAIGSVLAQTVEDWEAIVIDDASTDETGEVLARYQDPRIRILRHDVNIGNINTYNEAIGLARGEFFAILSADDRYRPRFVERVLDTFAAHPEAGVVYTNWERIDAEGELIGEQPTMPHRADGLYREVPRLLERSYIAGCCAVTRVRTLNEMGMYDARLPHTADTFLWRKIAVTAPFGYVNERLYEYRKHGAEMTYTRDRTYILETEHRIHLDEILSDPRTPGSLRARRNHFYAELYWTMAAWYAREGRWGRAGRRLVRALVLDPTVWTSHGFLRRGWQRVRHPRRLSVAGQREIA